MYASILEISVGGDYLSVSLTISGCLCSIYEGHSIYLNGIIPSTDIGRKEIAHLSLSNYLNSFVQHKPLLISIKLSIYSFQIVFIHAKACK